MTDDEQEARSLKFAPGTVNLRRLRSGRWAMYLIGGVGSPFWIGDLAGIAEAYAAQPAPPPRRERQPRPIVYAGIDLSKMEINL